MALASPYPEPPAELIKPGFTPRLAYFGPGVGKLEVVEQEACCARLVGGGGFVQIRAVTEDHGTTVYLETREWDAYVRPFMSQLSAAG